MAIILHARAAGFADLGLGLNKKGFGIQAA